MERNKIYQGNSLAVLKTFPDECIDCCVTSPPYWGLRDYGTAEWIGGDKNCDHLQYKLSSDKSTLHEAPEKKKMETGIPYKDICGKCGAKRKDEQLGLEKTPEEFVSKLADIFDEVKRVLKPTGTLWLNLGDSYWGGKGQSGSRDPEYQEERALNGESLNQKYQQMGGKGQTRPQDSKHEIIKPKDLIGIPWMVAFELRRRGWYLRMDIIWHKPNPMPESVTDRPTKSHEYIFLLSKSSQYFYDYEAIKEIATGYDGRKDTMMKGSEKYKDGNYLAAGNANSLSVKGQEHWKYKNLQEDGQQPNSMHEKRLVGEEYLSPVRNKRSVWTISTKGYSEAHFATFPEELIEPCILAGVPEEVCNKCGKPREKIIESEKQHSIGATSGQYWKVRNFKGDNTVHNTAKVIGLTDCECNKGFSPGIVLDPFSGAGTTAMLAKKKSRDYIGIELNPKYITMSEKRLYNELGMFS